MSNADYKIKYIAPSKKYALALEAQTFIPIDLNSKKALTESDNNIFVINALEETNIERNQTTKYRIQGKLEIITDNTLQDAWSNTPIPDDAWTPETNNLDKSFIPRNWLLNITYPASIDDTKELVTGGVNNTNTQDVYFTTKAYEGFQIKELEPYNYKSGITNILIRTSQKHGINIIDDYIYISPKLYNQQNGIPLNTYLGFHKILDFEPNNEEYGLILDTEYVVPTTLLAGTPIVAPFLGVGKRVFEPSSNDIIFADTTEVTQIEVTNITGGTTGDLIYTKIFSPSHFLRPNDFVEIRLFGTTVYPDTQLGMPNLYKVVSTPSTDTFVIKYEFPTLNTSTTQGPFNFNLNYRYSDGVVSEYYYRVNKILTEAKDYEVYKAAYSMNIFTDNYINNVFLFHFDKDIDVGGLVDNLGRPLSQLYLTTVKRGGNGCTQNYVDQGNCNGEVYDGFNNFSDNNQILDSNRTFTPISSSSPTNINTISFWQNNDPNKAGTIKGINAEYYNDFVEYNRAFLDERVLAETLGKFGPTRVYNNGGNTLYSSSKEGYTYKIHDEIRIRYFSTSIETAQNRPNEIFPDYAQVNNDGTVSWRDLLSIGFFEPSENGGVGVDYPFVNSKHYLFGEHPIYIRKQLATNLAQDRLDLTKFVKFNTNSTPNDEC